MAKIIRATEGDNRAYAIKYMELHGCQPCYPLFGFVKVDGQTCPIEFPNEGPDEPKYEVMAPEGFHFYEGPHSLLCVNQSDLQTRIAGGLVPCSEKCRGEEAA